MKEESATKNLYGDPIPKDFVHLSTRAVNVLMNCKFETKEQVLDAVLDGRLHPFRPIMPMPPSIYGGSRLRNYGAKTHREVCQWLGVPFELERCKRYECPHCGKLFGIRSASGGFQIKAIAP